MPETTKPTQPQQNEKDNKQNMQQANNNIAVSQMRSGKETKRKKNLVGIV